VYLEGKKPNPTGGVQYVCPICETALDTAVLTQGAKPRCKNCTDARGLGQEGVLPKNPMDRYKNCPDAKKIQFPSPQPLQRAASKNKIAKKKLSPEQQEKQLGKKIYKAIEDDDSHTDISDCGINPCESEEFKSLLAPNSDIKRKTKNLKSIDHTLLDLEIDG